MPARLLVVDDEESIRFAMDRYFRARGFDVDCARELEEAQALLANRRYAVVIADLRLTGVHGAEGLEIVAYVREHCPETRTILLTAHGSRELEEEARERGVDVVLRKPRPLPELTRTVLGLMETAL
jgi:DNA-binding response OmpR family regulator